MGDEHIVDLLDPCRFGGSHDPVGIPTIEAGPSRINQQGLAGRRDDQSSLSPLDVEWHKSGVASIWRGPNQGARRDRGQ